jgi:hypothetical protein
VLHAEYREEYHGKTGVITSTTDAWEPSSGVVHPFRVQVDGASGDIWAARVEIIDAPADEPAPARSSRAQYVDEARTLLEGTLASPSDIIRLAEFLAYGE